MVGERNRAHRRVTASGWICLVAGVIGAAAAVFLVLVDPAVPEDRFSYPLTPGGFEAIQAFFFVHHFGLVAGLYGLWRSGAVGTGRPGRWGAWGAIVGMCLLTATELLAVGASRSAYPSPKTDVLDSFYGLSSVLIGASLIVAGIAVVRAKVWRDWRRYVPLALGVYVFVPMTPAMFGPHAIARFGIGGWMLGFALLGWALVRVDERGAISQGRSVEGGDSRGPEAAARPEQDLTAIT